MAENQNNLYQSKPAIANKFLNPTGETSTLDEIITQVVPGTTLAETTSTPVKEYQSKPAVANKFLNADGTYSTLDEILARTIVGITQFDVQVVEELPEVGEKGVLYLVPNEGSGGNIYDEYVWIPSTESFEKIGTTEIDLSGYEQLINKTTTITSDSTDTQYPSALAVKTYLDNNQLITKLSEIIYLDDGNSTPYYLDTDGETEIPLEAGKFFMLLFGGLVVNGVEDYDFANGTIYYDENGYIQLSPPNMMVDGVTQKGYYYENGEWIEDEYGKQQLENVLNKTTTIDANSTDIEYPSARAVYEALAGKPNSTDVIKVANAYAYGTNNSSVPVLYKEGAETPMVEGQWYLVKSFTAPLNSRPIDEPTIVRYYIDSLTHTPTVIKLSATVDTEHGHAVNWYTTYTYETDGWTVHVSNVLESSFNKVASIDSQSTDSQYPSAKLLYDQLALKLNTTDLGKVPHISLSDSQGTSNVSQYQGCIVFVESLTTTEPQVINDLFWVVPASAPFALRRINPGLGSDGKPYITYLEYNIVDRDAHWAFRNEALMTGTTVVNNSSTDSQYPTAKAVYDQLATKVNKAGDTMTGALTTTELTVGSRATGSTVGAQSTAEGKTNTASGIASHAEGESTIASGTKSHAEGTSTQATGNDSHAEGYNTKANGYASHAEGLNTTVAGSAAYGHAEGNNTVASGNGAHAEGQATVSSGTFAHAEGLQTVSSGFFSHSEGSNTVAGSQSQHVQGEYNIPDETQGGSGRGSYAHIVGNGSSTNQRSNAHTVDWGGNAWFAGDVYVGSTSGKNRDAGSIKLAKDIAFTGTDGTSAGTPGLVPTPSVSDVDKYLKADGTWASVPNPSNITQQEIISLFS